VACGYGMLGDPQIGGVKWPATGDYVISVVNDDLEPEDAFVMASCLTDLGYEPAAALAGAGQSEGVIRDVDADTLVTLLADDTVDVLYHSGHGHVWDGVGGVSTSNDVLLDIDSFNFPNGFGAQYVIFATCSTMDVSISDIAFLFRRDGQTVLGYQQSSFDVVDTDVVRSFTSYRSQGAGFLQAWQLANMEYPNLQDRWVGFVRNNGQVEEYSLRSEKLAAAAGLSHSQPLNEAETVWLAQELTLHDLPAWPRVRVRAYEPEAQLDSQMDLFDADRPVTISHDEAADLAGQWLSQEGLRPAEAALGQVRSLTRQVGDRSPVVVGYVVEFQHEIEGWIPVGAGRADRIRLVVTDDGVQSVDYRWSELAVEPGPAQPSFLAPEAALEAAVEEIGSLLVAGAEFHVQRLEPVLAWPPAGQDELIPAYRAENQQGEQVVIDARSGRLVR
jgi:hypothetical protein